MKKLLAILWKDVFLRYTDPAVLLLAIALPLVITALIQLAFGDLVLGRGLPDVGIPVAIVNQDLGSQWGNLGQIFPDVSSCLCSRAHRRLLASRIAPHLTTSRR